MQQPATVQPPPAAVIDSNCFTLKKDSFPAKDQKEIYVTEEYAKQNFPNLASPLVKRKLKPSLYSKAEDNYL